MQKWKDAIFGEGSLKNMTIGDVFNNGQFYSDHIMPNLNGTSVVTRGNMMTWCCDSLGESIHHFLSCKGRTEGLRNYTEGNNTVTGNNYTFSKVGAICQLKWTRIKQPHNSVSKCKNPEEYNYENNCNNNHSKRVTQ